LHENFALVNTLAIACKQKEARAWLVGFTIPDLHPASAFHPQPTSLGFLLSFPRCLAPAFLGVFALNSGRMA
jgi:hypothetical protein